MAGLDPAIDVLCVLMEGKAWMPGSSPGMTGVFVIAMNEGSQNPARRSHRSIQRQPDHAAIRVALVAMRRLPEGFSQLPFLRFVAPLRRRPADDVVRAAMRAHRR